MDYIVQTKTAIKKVLLSKTPVVLPWSGGKDSSAVVNLTVVCAAEIIADHGVNSIAPITVVNADTLIENPAVGTQLKADIVNLEAFCDKHCIPMAFHQSKPSLNCEWTVNILSGRGLPIFSNAKNRSCSVDLKITPMNRLKKQVTKELRSKYGEPCSFLGTRFAESQERSDRMLARGESAEQAWKSDASGSMLSPIAHWSDRELWDYLAAVAGGRETGYTDFTGLTTIYRAGSSMDTKLIDGDDMPSCRFGCATCCVGRDVSLENMLTNDPDQYGYMTGINQLQRYLIATQYDFDKRIWIGRSIKDGYLSVSPDTYSPDMLEELFLICLTLDAREVEEAESRGIAPRFQLLHERAIIAIDALWSMQGLHKPHHALHLFDQVYNQEVRVDVPVVAATPRQPVPAKRYLYVGDEWENDSNYLYSGLRDIVLEGMTDPDGIGGCGKTEILKNGRVVEQQVYAEDGLFDVDSEAVFFLLDFELPDLLRKHDDEMIRSTSAFHYYTSTGVVQMSSRRQSGTTDFILRRTAFREDHGLIGKNYNLESIRERTVSEREMKADVNSRKVEEEPVSEVVEEDSLQLSFFEEESNGMRM